MKPLITYKIIWSENTRGWRQFETHVDAFSAEEARLSFEEDPYWYDSKLIDSGEEETSNLEIERITIDEIRRCSQTRALH